MSDPLLQLFCNPPAGPAQVVDSAKDGPGGGESSKLNNSLDIADDDHSISSFIAKDAELGPKLLQFTTSYLNHANYASTSPSHSLMQNIHSTTQRALFSSSIGDEIRNMDVFSHVINYAREFVAAVDQLKLESIESVPGHGLLHRVVRRDGVDRALIRNMSVASFKRFEEEVKTLDGSNGTATKLIGVLEKSNKPNIVEVR